MLSDIKNLQINYLRATRCWQSNNLKTCLIFCDKLTRSLNGFTSGQSEESPKKIYELNQLKQLVWFLKIRCLADDYHVNESLLLNEEDLQDEDQIHILSGRPTSTSLATVRNLTSRSRANRLTSNGTSNEFSKRGTTASGAIDGRARTGILTGRMASMISSSSHRNTGGSRTSGIRAASSYRPLTINLTATQTAFSRSTRPLLKYSTNQLLSKSAYEYLYNAQAVTNKCPDYRQCLEYLNLVQTATVRRQKNLVKNSRQESSTSRLSSNSSELLVKSIEIGDDERKLLGTFWLIAFGICHFNLHMNKQAEEYFQLALGLNKKHLDCYTWLIKIYLRANQLSKVIQICHLGLLETKSSILFNWLARVQSLMDDLFKANLNLKESLKYHPTNMEALANVGYFTFYAIDDKLEQSLKCFERIQQLSSNQYSDSIELKLSCNTNCSAELMNNLALCNFYCGYYDKVLPLFQKALLNSPSKEVTSDIWYNLSFVPSSLGLKSLAIACLKLALRNNSQNEEAINNLGVLKSNYLFEDDEMIQFCNRQEMWSSSQFLETEVCKELENLDEKSQLRTEQFDEAETYFTLGDISDMNDLETLALQQPEALFNMALIKRKRGQLSESVMYCRAYLKHDENNYHIKNVIREIQQIVSHDG